MSDITEVLIVKKFNEQLRFSDEHEDHALKLCHALPSFKQSVKTKLIDEIKDKLKSDFPLSVKLHLIILLNAVIERDDSFTCKYFTTKMLDRIHKTCTLANYIGNINDYYKVIPSESNKDTSAQKQFFRYLCQCITKWIPILIKYDKSTVSSFKKNLYSEVEVKKLAEKYSKKIDSRRHTIQDDLGSKKIKEGTELVNNLNINKFQTLQLSQDQLSKIKFNINEKINENESTTMKKNANSRKSVRTPRDLGDKQDPEFNKFNTLQPQHQNNNKGLNLTTNSGEDHNSPMTLNKSNINDVHSKSMPNIGFKFSNQNSNSQFDFDNYNIKSESSNKIDFSDSDINEASFLMISAICHADLTYKGLIKDKNTNQKLTFMDQQGNKPNFDNGSNLQLKILSKNEFPLNSKQTNSKIEIEHLRESIKKDIDSNQNSDSKSNNHELYNIKSNSKTKENESFVFNSFNFDSSTLKKSDSNTFDFNIIADSKSIENSNTKANSIDFNKVFNTQSNEDNSNKNEFDFGNFNNNLNFNVENLNTEINSKEMHGSNKQTIDNNKIESNKEPSGFNFDDPQRNNIQSNNDSFNFNFDNQFVNTNEKFDTNTELVNDNMFNAIPKEKISSEPQATFNFNDFDNTTNIKTDISEPQANFNFNDFDNTTNIKTDISEPQANFNFKDFDNTTNIKTDISEPQANFNFKDFDNLTNIKTNEDINSKVQLNKSDIKQIDSKLQNFEIDNKNESIPNEQEQIDIIKKDTNITKQKSFDINNLEPENYEEEFSIQNISNQKFDDQNEEINFDKNIKETNVINDSNNIRKENIPKSSLIERLDFLNNAQEDGIEIDEENLFKNKQIIQEENKNNTDIHYDEGSQPIATLKKEFSIKKTHNKLKSEQEYFNDQIKNMFQANNINENDLKLNPEFDQTYNHNNIKYNNSNIKEMINNECNTFNVHEIKQTMTEKSFYYSQSYSYNNLSVKDIIRRKSSPSYHYLNFKTKKLRTFNQDQIKFNKNLNKLKQNRLNTNIKLLKHKIKPKYLHVQKQPTKHKIHFKYIHTENSYYRDSLKIKLFKPIEIKSTKHLSKNYSQLNLAKTTRKKNHFIQFHSEIMKSSGVNKKVDCQILFDENVSMKLKKSEMKKHSNEMYENNEIIELNQLIRQKDELILNLQNQLKSKNERIEELNIKLLKNSEDRVNQIYETKNNSNKFVELSHRIENINHSFQNSKSNTQNEITTRTGTNRIQQRQVKNNQSNNDSFLSYKSDDREKDSKRNNNPVEISKELHDEVKKFNESININEIIGKHENPNLNVEMIDRNDLSDKKEYKSENTNKKESERKLTIIDLDPVEKNIPEEKIDEKNKIENDEDENDLINSLNLLNKQSNIEKDNNNKVTPVGFTNGQNSIVKTDKVIIQANQFKLGINEESNISHNLKYFDKSLESKDINKNELEKSLDFDINKSKDNKLNNQPRTQTKIDQNELSGLLSNSTSNNNSIDANFKNNPNQQNIGKFSPDNSNTKSDINKKNIEIIKENSSFSTENKNLNDMKFKTVSNGMESNKSKLSNQINNTVKDKAQDTKTATMSEVEEIIKNKTSLQPKPKYKNLLDDL